MSNPFDARPKWKKSGKWGEMPANPITPMPQVVTRSNTDGIVQRNQAPIAAPIEKPAWKRYIVPIVIIVGTLAAVAVVAIVVFIIKHRNKAKGQNVPKKFTPVKPPIEEHRFPDEQQQQKQQIIDNEPPIADELKNVAEVARKLGIQQEEEEIDARLKKLTTKQLMEEHERRKKEYDSENSDVIVEKRKKKTSMKDIAKKHAKSSDDDDDEKEPPLEEPMPRISYRELEEGTISKPKKKVTPQKPLTPKENTPQKPATPQKVPQRKPSSQNVKRNARTTAAYLKAIVEKTEPEDETKEDQEEIGVVEEDKQEMNEDTKDEEESQDSNVEGNEQEQNE